MSVITSNIANNIVVTNTETNVVTVTTPGPAGKKGDQGLTGPPGTINSNTGMDITGPARMSGSLSITGSVNITGSAKLNGADILTSALVNTDRITAGNVIAIVATSSALLTVASSSVTVFKITNTYVSGTFTGSFSGNGSGLNNIPASGIVGLNLSQIASGSVSASITPTNGFRVNTNSTINGNLTVTGSTLLLGDQIVNGDLIISGSDGVISSIRFLSGAVITADGGNIDMTAGPGGWSELGSNNGQNYVWVDDNGVYLVTSWDNNPSTSAWRIATGSRVLTAAGDLNMNGHVITGSVSGSFQGNSSGLFTGQSYSTGSFFGTSSGLFSGSVQGNVSGSFIGQSYSTGSLSGSFFGISTGVFTGQSSSTGSLSGSFTGQSSSTGSLSGSFFGVASGIFTGQSNATGSLSGSFIGQSYSTGSLSGSFFGIGSGLFSGSFQGNAAGLTNISASSIVGLNLTLIGTGSVSASVNVSDAIFKVSSGSQNFLVVSASQVSIGSSSLYVSRSINAYNINAGTPTSNQWQSNLNGSYFNNFTSQTDTSEILRFIAGLLSASAPDASPNTRTFASTTQTYANNGTGTVTAGYVPQSSSNADIIYLITKGFAQTGSTLFSGKTIYNNSAYSISYSSVAGGSTIVTSSADAQLFGLGTLTSGGPTTLYVSGAINWFYSDNNNETTTATSQSQNLLSNSTFSTTNGLTVAKINTANMAVIPAAYQDGKFATIFSNGLYNAGRSFSSVSSSGWYHISSSIAIATGSSAYTAAKTTADRIFFAPLTVISTNVGTNTKGVGYSGYNYLTATSRSLSGAPYLATATWQVSSSVTGLFSPLFGSSATLARQVVAGNAAISNPLTGAYLTSITTGLINTANTVYDSTGVTVRNTSTIPFLTDIVKLTGSLSLSIGTGNNIAQTGLSPTTYTVSTYGTDKDGTEGSALNTLTIPYFTSGTFGQPVASGAMAYYGQAQGYDGGTLTGGSEAFTGETYRVQLTNKFLSGSYAAADAWSTAYGLYNLGALDLQVKPGYLVRPGGTYAYWLTDPDNTKNYKYYARAFQRSAGTAATSLTINAGKTLVPWQSTTSGVSVAIIFKSSGILYYATPRIYDPSELTANLISSSMANDNFKNPFTPNIALYGNTGGSLNSTTYTVPLRGADGMTLDGTLQDLIVLVRYTGDQVPVTSIAVTYT